MCRLRACSVGEATVGWSNVSSVQFTMSDNYHCTLYIIYCTVNSELAVTIDSEFII